MEGVLFAELLASVPKGVGVSAILRVSGREDLRITTPDIFKELKRLNADIYLNRNLHAKFFIVDGKTALLGSSNLTDRGLNRFGEGNRKANLLLKGKIVGNLLQYFEKLKKESLKIDGNLVGFLLEKSSTTLNSVFILEPLEEGDFLITGGGYLFRILDLCSEVPSEVPAELFKESSVDWLKAYLFALSVENRPVYRAYLELLGLWDGGNLRRAEIPPPAGAPLFKSEKGILEKLSKKTVYGRDMECPVYVGGTKSFRAYLELAEIWRRHCAVLGITGSGKSFLTQRVVSRSVKAECGVKFIVLDPQGEYEKALKELLGKNFEKNVEVKRFPNTLFPITPDDFYELLDFTGFSHLYRGNLRDNKLLRDEIASFLKPLLGNISYLSTDLEGFLRRVSVKLKGLSEEIGAFESELKLLFGDEALNNQREVAGLIFQDSEKRVEIYDFSRILDGRSRLNIAGLVLKKLFFGSKGKTIVVVEEAHNFAPARGFGEVEAGRRNLALLMLEKIASEGRKLNIGLWIVAQRPAQVNKYVLSQTNTHFLFKLLDRNDLSAVETYLSNVGLEISKKLPKLDIGRCLVSGLGFPFEMELRIS